MRRKTGASTLGRRSVPIGITNPEASWKRRIPARKMKMERMLPARSAPMMKKSVVRNRIFRHLTKWSNSLVIGSTSMEASLAIGSYPSVEANT